MSFADLVGWIATAAVVSSYFFRNQTTLRRVQAISAVIWMTYGVLIRSAPVIVANIIVCAAAAFSSVVAARRNQNRTLPAARSAVRGD